MNYLNSKYDLISLGESTQFEIMNPTIIDLYNQQTTSASCASIYNNCVAKNFFYAGLAHLGCGTMDLTVLAGLACHSLVAGIHITENNICQSDYEECMEGKK